MEKKTKKVKVTRMVSEHGFLGSIAINQLNKGKEEEDGFRFRWLIPSMVFSAFRIEALCNLYGSQLFTHWDHFESMSFIGKVTLISEFLKMDVDYSSEPWQTLKKIGQFRNALAHAKPLKASETTELPEDAPNHLAFYPTSNKTITSYSSVEAAEKFQEVATNLEMMWLHQSNLQGYDIDTAGRPEYEIHKNS
ncbi:hypothetical protein SAMN05216271_3281 [Halopseudomonas sabulinigri]|uniref:Uncharacterized protein n=1 Tax=Halopseudomonas sabulinigri TaxID=472181 RepID=A0A1H1WNY1_9GAMM|nr:hypothetical protein [Halopseudomonas sabulinigri]SDS98712.1 hypothetical protein SAMN05216271_3281 [Halopseudomonas sabulinigri]